MNSKILFSFCILVISAVSVVCSTECVDIESKEYCRQANEYGFCKKITRYQDYHSKRCRCYCAENYPPKTKKTVWYVKPDHYDAYAKYDGEWIGKSEKVVFTQNLSDKKVQFSLC